MNKELQEYIKALSLKDKKNLSQKLGKVMEESGELARVVLPYDGADGTTHRFIEKEKVLEEAVDVMLTAISMPYALGFSHDEIEEMMWRKAQKWQGIQAKSEKVEYPIPYEIHITVDISGFDSPDGKDKAIEYATESFVRTCKGAGVKPIVLDLESGGDSVMKDVMTSSHIIGNNTEAYTECVRISNYLKVSGFKVVRKKIETVPWHPAAPCEPTDKMPEDCYFEAHIGCVITPRDKTKLKDLAEIHNAHLSRNFFKKLKDGKFVNMITLRNYKGTLEDFEYAVDELKKALELNDINFEKVIIEFSIYDTKVSHDFKWLEKQELV